MNESLFIQFVKSIWPKLALYIKEKVNNGKELTYLHKTMLTKVYSADQKWEGTSANTTYVSADVVAMDSPLPPKKRDAIAQSNGVLPKIGMKKVLRETQINTINIMRARLQMADTPEAKKAEKSRILTKLTDDAVACSIGIDERNEANFLTALAEGVIIVEDEDNTGVGIRLDYGYLEENMFGVDFAGSISKESIERVIDAADAKGVSFSIIAIALSTYKKMRQEQWAKEMVASYKGMSFSDGAKLPVPIASDFDEAFADEFGGIRFLKIDRSVIVEKNGIRKSYKPFSANKLVFLVNENVGSLVWGTLAEATNPVAGVVYSTVDEYKLIAKYSKTDPLQEFTSGQAIIAPVIENVEQIFVLDANVVHNAEPAAINDETPVADYVTVWGASYKKADLITAMKAMGVTIAVNATDETVVKKIGALTEEEQTSLKAAVTAV